MSNSKLYDEIGAFTAIPNWVIEMGDKIGPDGLALFQALRYHSGVNGEIFPAYDLLQVHTGLTRRRIAIAIRKLEELKIIERQKRFGQSTIYRLKNLPTATSSTPPVLMDEPPVVQQVDCISTPPVPSVVQQVHTNKTHLTRLKEQDSLKEPPERIFSRSDILPLLARVSGLVAFPSKETERAEQMLSMIEAYGMERAEQALKAECDRWKKTQRKDNSGTYRVTNMTWVDWAQDALLGNPLAEKKFSELETIQEMLEWQKTHPNT